MAMEKITEDGVAIALVTGTCALTDEQTALDLIMEARYTLGAERIAIEKAAVFAGFFHFEHGPCRGRTAKIHQLRRKAGGVRRLFRIYQQAPAGFYPREQPGPGCSFSRHPAGSHPPSGRGVTACGAAAAMLSATPACPHRGRSHTAWQSLGLEQVQKGKAKPAAFQKSAAGCSLSKKLRFCAKLPMNRACGPVPAVHGAGLF